MDAFSLFHLKFAISVGSLNVGFCVCATFLPGYCKQTTAGTIDFITDLAKRLLHLAKISADPLESSNQTS